MKRMPMARRALCAVVLALVGLILSPGTAHAANWETYMSGGTSLCLQNYNGNNFSSKNEVGVAPCIDSETWASLNWLPVAYGSYREIRGQASGYCLDSNTSHQVYANPCGNGTNNYQLWQILAGPNSSILFKDKATGWCLDGNGDSVYSNPCQTGNVYQQWH